MMDGTWYFLLPMPAKNMKATLPETLTSPTDIWSQVSVTLPIVSEGASASDSWLYQLGYLSYFQERPTLSRVLHAEMRRFEILPWVHGTGTLHGNTTREHDSRESLAIQEGYGHGARISGTAQLPQHRQCPSRRLAGLPPPPPSPSSQRFLPFPTPRTPPRDRAGAVKVRCGQAERLQRELAAKLSAKRTALTEGDSAIAAAVDSDLRLILRSASITRPTALRSPRNPHALFRLGRAAVGGTGEARAWAWQRAGWEGCELAECPSART